MTAPYWLNPRIANDFPDVELALRDPDGLLAVGGDLRVERLLAAYAQGIFPWYSEGQPILWWSPDPRMVLYPEQLKVSRSLRKILRKNLFEITLDTAFENVIRHCAKQPRPGQNGTWIMQEMIEAYLRLHKAGYAHSVEVWHDNQLVGGLYGVSLGKLFFGESMFSLRTDASKVAMFYLCELLKSWQFKLIDCQVYTAHLASLGAKLIPRKQFTQQLSDQLTPFDLHRGSWKFPDGFVKDVIDG